MESNLNTISSHLISKHGFNKINKNEKLSMYADKVDIDKFDCLLRVHDLHYLFYSDVMKHFSIGIFNENGKGRAGGGIVRFNTVMIPKPIYTTDEADLLIKATTIK